MGAQQSRLQKRSVRQRFSSIPYTATAIAAVPAKCQEVGRPIRGSRLQPSGGMDRETAEALINKTLHLTLDLQQVHHQLNEVLKLSQLEDVIEPRRELHQEFTFEGPVCPLRIDMNPACLTPGSRYLMEDEQQKETDIHPRPGSKLLMPNVVRRRRARSPLKRMSLHKPASSPPPSPSPSSPISLSRSLSQCSSASSYHTATSRADETWETVPSLTASSSRYSTMDSSTLSEWICSIRLSSDMGTLEGSRQHDHLLAPAIALCDQLLDESVSSLIEAREVKLDSHRVRGKPLSIAVGRHESDVTAMGDVA